jgi:hypothetical protein
MSEEATEIEHLPRKTGVSPLGERYLDILINEYRGRVPWGHKTKIAKRLDCSVSALSQFDRGYYPAWIQERDRRMKELAGLADPLNHVIELNKLYEEAIAYRKRHGQPLTSKDPLDILTEMRKATFGGGGDGAAQARQVNTTVFNFERLSDEALSNAIEQVTQILRDGGLDDLGEIIDGQFTDGGSAESPTTDIRGGTPRLDGGEGTESGREVEESPEE